MILITHERDTRFDLRIQNGIPQLLRRYGLASASLALVTLIQLFEFSAIDLMQIGCFVGREERPFCIGLNAIHTLNTISGGRKGGVMNEGSQEVGYPQRVE